MPHPIDLAHIASLIGDPTRAGMLARLLEGPARTAGELAREAGISPQTASGHLARLLDGGLLRVEVQGRHRYYRLAHADVARALEALNVLVPQRASPVRVPEPLRFARTCYDHLAGTLGVALAEGLERRGYLEAEEDGYALTPEGTRFVARLGVDTQSLAKGRRTLARRCLDWSERRAHVGGALGAALTERLFTLRWIARRPEGRGVRLTVEGRRGFDRELGLTWP
ncbi:winged helix-turn-helix domain-containing protein [Myxococcus sp. K15C18031901]|uniref:ArsR/SmtB family transcription factor n=1 Tax=Myxococcus dinghuensis TaxID=2906761 RepID=UPI0020A7095E|nr:winged helix-turn-helix domain-containing protein [Myxococcus dinghuensis]MCP3099661.1 winged helix-turn-helix domain-containing protein [Myxococcus dinghuensis]